MDFLGAFQWANLSFLWQGLRVTLQVTVITILLSLLFGTLLGIIRYLKIAFLSKGVGFVIDIIRNLPLLLIIFFTYFALPQMGLRLNIFWSAIAAMTVFESAMISEIIRGGMEAVDKGQTEAALSTGLTYPQAIGYVILPQAIRSMLSALVSQLIALIKDTSLATIISLPELTHNARIIYGQNTNQVIPMFVIMAACYWGICFLLSVLSKQLKF